MKGIIGIDEVGRGPLAGPVTVCAFYLPLRQAGLPAVKAGLPDRYSIKAIFENGLKDSKKLSAKKREEIFQKIKKEKFIFAISSRSSLHIDKNGINNSIKSCIDSCLNELEKKGVDIYKTQIRLDGGLKLLNEFKNQSTHIKGDENFPEIALASIMAKVTRDKYMEKLAKKFPKYDWHKNAGYGTKSHRDAIKLHGVSAQHRISYLKNLV